MQSKSLTKIPNGKSVNAVPLNKFATIPKELTSQFNLPKSLKAGVIVDKSGTPQLFVFDTYALWDILCAADEAFEESASAKKYVSSNPVGWLIDAIEEKLSLKPRMISKLRHGIKEARRLGVIPFNKIKFDPSLS